MQYRTIVMELIEQNPKLHEELRQQRRMLATINQTAMRFRENHLELAKTMDRGQAFEIALRDIEQELLPAESPAPIPAS